MQTRKGSLSRKSAPKTAEEQQQIVSDAKLAARISRMPRSPTKKVNKRAGGNKYLLHKPPKPQGRIGASSRRLVIANIKEEGDIANPTPAEALQQRHQISGK